MSWFPTVRGAVISASDEVAAAAVLASNQTLQIQAEVTSVFLEHRQARALDDEGFAYALTSGTPGVEVRGLRQGQRLQCTVEVDLRRVLHVEVLG